MRKMMTKEVTKTTVKLASMKMENGLPVAVTLPDQTLIGNVSMEKAQKEMSKKFDVPVTVLAVEVDTTVYELSVEEFIKHASVKVEQEELSM